MCDVGCDGWALLPPLALRSPTRAGEAGLVWSGLGVGFQKLYSEYLGRCLGQRSGRVVQCYVVL